jgi:hypothetical protein
MNKPKRMIISKTEKTGVMRTSSGEYVEGCVRKYWYSGFTIWFPTKFPLPDCEECDIEGMPCEHQDGGVYGVWRTDNNGVSDSLFLSGGYGHAWGERFRCVLETAVAEIDAAHAHRAEEDAKERKALKVAAVIKRAKDGEFSKETLKVLAAAGILSWRDAL